MKVLVDGDVVLYLALARNEEDNLQEGAIHYFNILKDVRESHFVEKKDVEIYMSTDGENFRKNLYPCYKANRRDKVPPPNLKALKGIIEKLPNCFGSPNGEADDHLLIRAAELDAMGEPWVIATVDKDLKTYPGRFYNLRTHETDFVTPEQAATFMVQQFVMGDGVDGIAGLRGWGPKKTQAVINEEYSLEENYDRAKEIWRDNCPENYEEAFNETANLAYIRRCTRYLKPLEFFSMSASEFQEMSRIPVSDH